MSKIRCNTPAPATEAQKIFAHECFIVKNGVVYWREERPDHHFNSSNSSWKRTWKKNWAGKPAGRADGRGFRVTVSIDGVPVNRSIAWFYEALTGEKQPEPSKFKYCNLMSILNNNFNRELSENEQFGNFE